MGSAESRFKVIDGGQRPAAGTRRKRRGAAALCLCRTCQADIGTASNVWVKAKLGLFERDGKVEGGTEAYVCAMCLARGKITRAT